jgi:hypothetical protein
MRNQGHSIGKEYTNLVSARIDEDGYLNIKVAAGEFLECLLTSLQCSPSKIAESRVWLEQVKAQVSTHTDN